MMNADNSLSKKLAHFVADIRYQVLPERTISITKRCLLDALGVSLAASTRGEGCRAFVDLAIQQGGLPESTIFGTQVKVPVMMAAFANGAMAHALDFEDAHDETLLHPNAPNVPVALAISEAMGSISGRQLITSLVVGCEVSCRMARALRVRPDDYGWYTPPIIAAYGATATAGYLYGLTATQIVDAFSLTLCQAICSAEIKNNPNSVVRAVRDAFSAKAAVVSAQLAKKGVTGFERPLEGNAGFYQVMARGGYDPEVVISGLGNSFEIEKISFKPWPTCRGTHVYIEAALMLAKKYGIDINRIHSIHAHGHRVNKMLAEPEQEKKRPATAISAKFSIPYVVATALYYGEVGLMHFSSEALLNPEVLSLAERVYFFDVDSSAENKNVTQGSLTIVTDDQRQYSQSISRPYGDPDNPLTDKFLVNKFNACIAFSGIEMDAGNAQLLAEKIFSLEKVDNVLFDLAPHY